ncbi:probable serine/threonine-protein kinase mps1 [Anopheles albimanus]|uniref:probable serine/threonine-protein kinase mps1 n=1 Tax=Anopheles albimanus TaxID=7167 RepID=UPI00164009EB|nr:probable serine/threonine-protein kinase mps1 [Anopheles albimanus]
MSDKGPAQPAHKCGEFCCDSLCPRHGEQRQELPDEQHQEQHQEQRQEQRQELPGPSASDPASEQSPESESIKEARSPATPNSPEPMSLVLLSADLQSSGQRDMEWQAYRPSIPAPPAFLRRRDRLGPLHQRLGRTRNWQRYQQLLYQQQLITERQQWLLMSMQREQQPQRRRQKRDLLNRAQQITERLRDVIHLSSSDSNSD